MRVPGQGPRHLTAAPLSRRTLLASLAAAGAAVGFPYAAAAQPAAVRLGVLKFGTVSWELDTISHHGFDAAHDVTLEVSAFRRRGCHRRRAAGRCGRYHRLRLAMGVTPAQRGRRPCAGALFERGRRRDGRPAIAPRRARRPARQVDRRRRRAARQELAAAEGARPAPARLRSRCRKRGRLRGAAADVGKGAVQRARRGAQLLALLRAPGGGTASAVCSAPTRPPASLAQRATSRPSATSSTMPGRETTEPRWPASSQRPPTPRRCWRNPTRNGSAWPRWCAPKVPSSPSCATATGRASPGVRRPRRPRTRRSSMRCSPRSAATKLVGHAPTMAPGTFWAGARP